MDEPQTGKHMQLPTRTTGRMPGGIRAVLHKAVPSHFNDPFGLALRILRSGNRDARSALIHAGLGLGLVPVDWALGLLAGAWSRDLDGPKGPVLFITGPPRSGTTLMHQLLIRSLPVAYITNLASLLPRSAAAGAFGLTSAMANDKVRLDSYYGRTRSLSGPSDGLEFWDQWLGADRRAIPQCLLPGADAAMRSFFGRLERSSGRPIVAKNNGLLGSAHLVARALPTARFVCLRRDPLYLAQSLLKARRDIHGTSELSYGMDHQDGSADPVEDVWRQVRFYDDLAATQQARLGTDRFMITRYEDLCEKPSDVVQHIARAVFGIQSPMAHIAPLHPHKRRSLDAGLFERLVATCDGQFTGKTPGAPD